MIRGFNTASNVIGDLVAGGRIYGVPLLPSFIRGVI